MGLLRDRSSPAQFNPNPQSFLKNYILKLRN
jgi:hypothetical protein